MADTKKPAKKATPAKEQTPIEQLLQKRADLLELRKSNRAGELVNPRAITSARKEIARLLTAIRAEERTAAKESK
jgi:ribosomal protein L29